MSHGGYHGGCHGGCSEQASNDVNQSQMIPLHDKKPGQRNHSFLLVKNHNDYHDGHGLGSRRFDSHDHHPLLARAGC